MSKPKVINSGRRPPDEAALVVILGLKIYLSRWGISIVVGATLLITLGLLIWMSPTEASEIITVLTRN
jgi:hypothetical protein